MKFSENYVKGQYNGLEQFQDSTSLFDGLKQLHKLWYQINELDKKFSGRAEDKRQNLVADFYVLAEPLLEHISAVYKQWSDAHEKDGWWERSAREEIEETGTISRGQRGTIDIRPKIQELLEEQMVNDTDWRVEFEESESSFGADLFLRDRIVQTSEVRLTGDEVSLKFNDLISDSVGRDEEDKAYDYIKSNDLMDEFYKWAVETENYNPRAMVSIDDIYGDDWWTLFKNNPNDYPHQHDMLMLVLENPQLKDTVWNEWLQMWPGYEDTRIQVDEIITKLWALQGSNDVNQIMSTLSLALNVAHNSGLMYDHLDLSKQQMSGLSNLDTKPWDKEIKHYSVKRYSKYWRYSF
jgi:hypothetical protein